MKTYTCDLCGKTTTDRIEGDHYHRSWGVVEYMDGECRLTVGDICVDCIFKYFKKNKSKKDEQKACSQDNRC